MRISVGLLITSAVLLLAACRGEESPAVEVELQDAARETIVETVTSTGKIQPKQQVNISADVSAKITELHVVEGQWVEQGKLLVKLDQERYLASVENAEANVRAAQANALLVKENLNRVEKDYERAKQMVSRKLDSEAALDTAYAAHQVELARLRAAEESVEQARAILKQANDDLAKTTIFAPMSGTVSLLRKEAGEIAIGSQFQEDVIMVISDLTNMEALIDVDEIDITTIAVGDKAEVIVDALNGSKLRGTVTEIANSAKEAVDVNTEKTEFEITIAIEESEPRLRPGMTAKAIVTTDIKDNVIAVPLQSVTVRSMEQLKAMEGIDAAMLDTVATDDAGFVELLFTVVDDKAEVRPVTTGIQGGGKIEITSGIEAGDPIVSGSYRAISKDLAHGSDVTEQGEGSKG